MMDGYWKTEQKQPPAPGWYRVVRGAPGPRMKADAYYWNGSYWVTPGGSPSRAVIMWCGEAAPDRRTAQAAGTGR